MTRYWRLVAGEVVEYDQPETVLRAANPRGHGDVSGRAEGYSQ